MLSRNIRQIVGFNKNWTYFVSTTEDTKYLIFNTNNLKRGELEDNFSETVDYSCSINGNVYGAFMKPTIINLWKDINDYIKSFEYVVIIVKKDRSTKEYHVNEFSTYVSFFGGLRDIEFKKGYYGMRDIRCYYDYTWNDFLKYLKL